LILERYNSFYVMSCSVLNVIYQKMKYILLVLIVLQIACGSKIEETMKFVIPVYNENFLKDSIKYIPYDYYALHNVILIESNQKIYYHNNWTSCGTGWKVTNPPREIDFEKYPLLIFESVDSLINVINQTEKSPKFIMMASNSDTIYNPLYFELKNRIKERDNMHEVSTRKVTEDEKNAIEKNYSTEWNNKES
jgi:hypothetical protein